MNKENKRDKPKKTDSLFFQKIFIYFGGGGADSLRENPKQALGSVWSLI